jgi:cytochrome P450
MSAPIMNMIEDIYPSPTVFDPNRFLENPRLDKYKIAFSRGPRRCLGVSPIHFILVYCAVN